MVAGWTWLPKRKGFVNGCVLSAFGAGGFFGNKIGSAIVNPNGLQARRLLRRERDAPSSRRGRRRTTMILTLLSSRPRGARRSIIRADDGVSTARRSVAGWRERARGACQHRTRAAMGGRGA